VFSKCFRKNVSSVSFFYRCMLQKFHLDILKVDRTLYMLQCDSPPQSPVVAAGAPCMHARSEGMKHYMVAGARSGASGPRLAHACSSRRRLDASVRPDVRALVLPLR
jgi:hypothetical protein